MANIFKLTSDYKAIQEMADELDPQTLDDMIEAIQDATEEKVSSLIAVVKSVEGDLEVAKTHKKYVEERISTMNSTITRLKEYIHLGVETVGKPKKGAEQFVKLEFKGVPHVKSAWTQFNPPKVEVIDDRLIPDDYLVPQPAKVNSTKIAADWKKKQEEYQAQKNAFILDLSTRIGEEFDEQEADERLEAWEKENRHISEIQGVDVTQKIAVRYR